MPLSKLRTALKNAAKRKNTSLLVALDASAAFDVLSRQLVIATLQKMGAGPLMIKFTESFLYDVSQHVDINGCISDPWTLDVGAGQGRVLSPPLYNIGTISQYYWTIISKFFGFADDNMDVISAPSIQECNEKISQLLSERCKWYDLAGMTLNAEKTQIVGFGFKPATQTVLQANISPSSSLTFLGMTIQDNLGIDMHVSNLCKKIRSAAARIRSEAHYFNTKDRRTLYQAWINGVLCSNGGAYLPLLNEAQASNLQLACNQGIRAIFGIPRKSRNISISMLRSSLNLPSIEQIAERKILTLAWKSRSSFDTIQEGPQTRARSNGNIPAPDQRGLKGKMISTATSSAWNRLPLECKMMDSYTQAKTLIKKLTS